MVTHVAGEDGHALDHVLQLAHVARPASRLERLVHGRRRWASGFRPFSLQNDATKASASERMSSTRSRSARAADGEDVEAEEEILAEAPGRDLLAEILVGRGEHAHVDVDDVLAADAADLARLQRAQHLGLRDEIHVADLVEEQRAAVRLLEEAALARLRAGEGAPLVPEELALDELARDGGAVDLDERRVLARARGGGSRG